ncbi:GHKL domain-containing protein [Lacibacter luteus]|uniref:histidine kinase n=1 Tax=Lacibacter luteus TaxID=2508719 RepID=A0A4Q1CNN9_9BACT|nr:ATP-binding protein [Lacibacter luteus]RXK62331.1 GHKL domain-containing protein [Lacibacter luteus]
MQPSIEDLRKVIAFSDLPDEHLQWIIDRSKYEEYQDGDIIVKYGDPAEVMWIALEGKVTFYMYINGRQVYYFTFENTSTTGGVGGLLPYSRMKTMPGYSYALGDVKMLRLHKDHFHELELLNPDLIQRLIGYMTERARIFATTQLQHEKIDALGNLAAGIAHELNNPAAAISGIADELTKRVTRNYILTRQLLDCNMTAEHIQTIHSIIEKKETTITEITKHTTMQRIQAEDDIEDWLESNGIKQREAAETFAEFGLSLDELEQIRTDAGADAFTRVVPWLENLISSQKMIKDLSDASDRISKLVASIKSHVHMDRTNDLQTTNVHTDIENTLTLLGFKLRGKNIEVVKKFCADMPVVPAYVGELNQVWTNLIDNAIFALEQNGILTIETTCTSKDVTVAIIDNGKGIPKEIASRIFDPFFTTKKVGEGTGIGLDIVNRIIKRHNADIKVESAPGRTVFKVCIPLSQQIISHNQ